MPCPAAIRCAVAVVLLGAACEPGDDNRDAAVSEQSASAFDSSYGLYAISNRFALAEGLGDVPVPTARRTLLLSSRGAFVRAVSRSDCLVVESDETTFLELSFDDCALGLLGRVRVNGTLRAELSFDTAPCGSLECPVAALFELSTAGLQFVAMSDDRSVEIAGTWTVRDPVDSGQPTSYAGGTRLTVAGAASAMASTTALWEESGPGCLLIDFDSQLSLDDTPDAGVIGAAGSGIERCLGTCPRAGTIRLAFGTGTILTWTYGGDATALVTGPGGVEFEVALACEP